MKEINLNNQGPKKTRGSSSFLVPVNINVIDGIKIEVEQISHDMKGNKKIYWINESPTHQLNYEICRLARKLLEEGKSGELIIDKNDILTLITNN